MVCSSGGNPLFGNGWSYDGTTRGTAEKGRAAGLARHGWNHAMSLLEVVDLQKSYDGHVAVDGLSFHVEAGEVFGLLGPNGAGKSTTMMMLAGLRPADSGRVTIGGFSFDSGSRELKQILGVVPQDL